jgi:hypothetical protein
MVRAPFLVILDTSHKARYTLYTDASGFAVEVVLLQYQGIGLQHVAYHARKMKKHEVHYYVHEQELMAVRDVLMKFRCYLYGEAGFTVIAPLRTTTRCDTSFGSAVCLLDMCDSYKF